MGDGLVGLDARVQTVEERLAGLQGRRLANADMLQDRRVASTAPSGNDRLVWDSTNKAWKPQTPTREIFIYPSNLDNALGNWAIFDRADGEALLFTFHLPADFNSLTSVNIVMIPDTEETIQADLDVSNSATGEAQDNDADQSLNQTLAIAAGDVDALTEWDISGIGTLFTTVAASDYVGIKFTSNTTNLRIVGCRVVWKI